MPYPNEHAARLTDPDKYDDFRRSENWFYEESDEDADEGVDVIWGIIEDDDGERTSEMQALRFRVEFFPDPEDAKDWLADHPEFEVILFEPATGDEDEDEDDHNNNESRRGSQMVKAKKVPLAACQFKAEGAVALLAADDKGKKSARRFRIVGLSGKPFEAGWWGRVAIDLDGAEFRQRMPALRQHDPAEIVGFTDEVKANGQMVFEGPFSRRTKAAREVLALADEGFPWQGSVRAEPLAIVELGEGVSEKVNGQDVEGPATIFRRSRITEISFVPLGADSETEAASLEAGGEILVEVLGGKEMSEEHKTAEGVEASADDDQAAAEAQEGAQAVTAQDEAADAGEGQDEAQGAQDGAEGEGDGEAGDGSVEAQDEAQGGESAAEGEGDGETEDEDETSDEGDQDGEGAGEGEAAEAAAADPVKAERERAVAIASMAADYGVPHEGAKLIAEGVELAAVEGKLRTEKLSALKAAAPESPGVGDGAQATEDGPEKWEAEFAASNDLQSEFSSASQYVAFMAAAKDGRANVATGKRAQ